MPDLGPYVGRWVALVREQAATRQPMIRIVFDLSREQDTSVYLVGGSVRDLLLGSETHDLDFVVVGDGLKLARYIADRVRGAFVALDQERRTGRVILSAKGLYLDFASLRGANLHADLQDRDFTINAMALEQTSAGELRLIDPLGGSKDLADRVLRVASPTSFSSDPARLLRAVRMQAQFGCQMEPGTRALLRAAVPQLGTVSAERIRDEWFNILQQPTGSSALRELHQLGLLYQIAPPLAALEGLEQPAPHHFDGLTHSFETVRAVEGLWDGFRRRDDTHIRIPDTLYAIGPRIRERYESPICDERSHLALLKCAALLHDIGKPRTRQVDPGGRIRFFGHEHAGAQIASALARDWRCSKTEVKMLRVAIEAHMRPTLLAQEPSLTRRAIYRFYRDTGPFGIDAGFIALADYVATRGADLSEKGWTQHAETVAKLWAAYYEQKEVIVAPPPLLSGNDLIELGVTPGPRLGELLERVREAQVAGELATRQEALDSVREWLTQTNP